MEDSADLTMHPGTATDEGGRSSLVHIGRKVRAGAGTSVGNSANERTKTGSGYCLEDQIGFLIRKVHQRVSALHASIMADFDLTPTQFAALAKVGEMGEVSQNHLGRLVAMDPATNQGVVRRLLKRGLLHRRDDPEDRRRTLLTLTAAGTDLLNRSTAAALRVAPAVMRGLNPEERETLLAMLKRIS